MPDKKYSKTDPEQMLIEDMVKLSKSIKLWVRYSFQWGKGELAEAKGPEDWQNDILQAIDDGLMTPQQAIQCAVASGHGVGKSALVSWIILWSLSTYADTKGIVTANTETQLKTKTWAELAKWYRLFIAKHWFVFTATAIYSIDPAHERTWRFDMIPWSEHKTEAFAGMHNKGKRICIIFDEASAIPDVIWEVTEGALTDQNTEILWMCFGNPTRNTGRFYQCFHGLRHRWNHRQVDSRTVTITNKEQIKRWVDDYGDDSDFCRVRIKGQFPRASDHQFIPSDIVDAAMERVIHPNEHNYAAKIIGVDRAWSGDRTRIWLRQGNMAKRLATFDKGEDDVVVAGHLARLEDEIKADAVFIDFGYGTGLFSVGNQLGRKWSLVGFGEKASDPRYLNKRVEMWGKLKEWLVAGGVLPKDQDLRNDLIGPEAYEVTLGPNAGKIKLESKEDMKARGLPSPDDADALCLTFAFPVMNKNQRQFEVLINTHVDNFDPFNLNKGQSNRPQFNPLSPVAEPFEGVKAQSWREAMTKKG